MIITLLLSIQFSFGQKITKQSLLSLQKTIYHKAMENYDLETAKISIYQILAIEGKQSTYLDTLGYLYFNQQNYISYIRVADQILKKELKLPILERKAIALENIGAIKKAIATYEKLFALKKTPIIAYKLGKLQYELKRVAEAFTTLHAMENEKFPKQGYLKMPGAKKGEQQNIAIKAAYYNLLGMTSYELHNYDTAIAYFDKALKIQPNFFVAKQNKGAIKAMVDAQKKNK